MLDQNQKICNTATDNTEQTDNRQTENSITEATLIPVDHWGKWANFQK